MNIPPPVCRLARALITSHFAVSNFVAPVSPSSVSRESPMVGVTANKSEQTARREQSAPTHCAEVYRYWSAKNKKCMDARDKPSAIPPGMSPKYWVPGRKGAEPGCMRGKAGC